MSKNQNRLKSVYVTEEYPHGQYGLLKNGVKVKIYAWTVDDNPEQEIYFYYSLCYRLRKRRDSAWARKEDFIHFASSKRELRKFWRSIKG